MPGPSPSRSSIPSDGAEEWTALELTVAWWQFTYFRMGHFYSEEDGNMSTNTTFPPTTVTWTDPMDRFTPIVNPGEQPPAGEIRQVVVGVQVEVNQTQADGTRNVTPQTAGQYLDNDSGQEVAAAVALEWRSEWVADEQAHPGESDAQIQQDITGTQLTPTPLATSGGAAPITSSPAPVTTSADPTLPPPPFPPMSVAPTATATAPQQDPVFVAPNHQVVNVEHVSKLHSMIDELFAFIKHHFPKL